MTKGKGMNFDRFTKAAPQEPPAAPASPPTDGPLVKSTVRLGPTAHAAVDDLARAEDRHARAHGLPRGRQQTLLLEGLAEVFKKRGLKVPNWNE